MTKDDDKIYYQDGQLPQSPIVNDLFYFDALLPGYRLSTVLPPLGAENIVTKYAESAKPPQSLFFGVPDKTYPGPVVPPTPPYQLSGQEIAKRMVLSVADRTYNFIYGDLYAGYAEAKTIALIKKTNKLLEALRPIIYNSLSDGVRKKFTQKTTAADLGTKGLLTTANAMSIMDLVKIWFYELGDRAQLGSEANPIVFGRESVITKMLMEHRFILSQSFHLLFCGLKRVT